MHSGICKSVLTPIDANLSIVPPVCPKPLPDIFATLIPHAAQIGPRIKDTLSRFNQSLENFN